MLGKRGADICILCGGKVVWTIPATTKNNVFYKDVTFTEVKQRCIRVIKRLLWFCYVKIKCAEYQLILSQQYRH